MFSFAKAMPTEHKTNKNFSYSACLAELTFLDYILCSLMKVRWMGWNCLSATEHTHSSNTVVKTDPRTVYSDGLISSWNCRNSNLRFDGLLSKGDLGKSAGTITVGSIILFYRAVKYPPWKCDPEIYAIFLLSNCWLPSHRSMLK